jgi:DNA-binding LacI/PurR family transcriptional regulator
LAVIKDVAKLAGLSVAVVSKYLKDSNSVRPDTRERIEAAIKELNYVPSAAARMLRTGQTNLISVVLSNITNPYFAELFEAIRNEAMKCGYAVILQNVDEFADQSMLSSPNFSVPSIIKVDGVIICFPESDELADMLSQQVGNVPISVLSWHRMPKLSEGSVILDVKDGIYQSTRHLIQMGHRNFGYIGGHDWSHISREKRSGFLEALTEAGIEFNDSLEYHGRYRMDTGYQGAEKILKQDKATTAIVAENDILAIGCIKYCSQHNLSVPEQVAVTGFDDISLASMYEPSITSASHPLDKMAKAAVQYIASHYKRAPELEGEQVFKASLVIRNSSSKNA